MATVLLTGASGFIAGWVLKFLLEKGYTVIATVRSEDKAEYLKGLYPADSKLSFVIVPDIAAPNAFDEAIKTPGIDYIIHTASPFHFRVTDPVKDLLDPAIKGTESVLTATKAFAPQVKHVVITSSFAAIIDASYGNRPGYVYTEKDFNPVTWDEAVTGPPATTYRASKTFAEKAAWDFLEKEKPNFSISTINPPLVWGPMLHQVTPETINTSNDSIWTLMNGSQKTIPPLRVPLWVDVRNVALAHVLALEKEAAKNQRYFLVAGSFSFKEITDYLLKTFPELKGKVPTELTAPEPTAAELFGADHSKSVKDLGIEYIGLEQTIYDLGKQLVDWVK
ncbi:uncharacterized protein V2V93DRAFT_141175 [Kockiozyma suomiensis]|uniref:uncharacterized protein n=1 Tax=Kockiozyma suomiensis TaxID=1337062 RepID=UPI003343E640